MTVFLIVVGIFVALWLLQQAVLRPEEGDSNESLNQIASRSLIEVLKKKNQPKE